MSDRIIDIATTATSAADDDYLVMDGETNGTRKVLVSNVGGEKTYDYTSVQSPSINSNGLTTSAFAIVAANDSDLTTQNVFKVGAYLSGSTNTYPLIVTSFLFSSTLISSVTRRTAVLAFKSISSSVQGSSNTVSGTLHIVAPFEIESVLSWK